MSTNPLALPLHSSCGSPAAASSCNDSVTAFDYIPVVVVVIALVVVVTFVVVLVRASRRSP